MLDLVRMLSMFFWIPRLVSILLAIHELIGIQEHACDLGISRIVGIGCLSAWSIVEFR